MAQLQPPIRSYADAKLRAAQGYQVRLPHGLAAEPGNSTPADAAALLVSSAGCEAANGIYQASPAVEKVVFQHLSSAGFKIYRDEQVLPSGKVKHGWLLSGQGEPLYGVPSESLSVPLAASWRCYKGPEPAPRFRAFKAVAEAVYQVVDDAEVATKEALKAEEWERARQHCVAALEALSRANQRFGEAFEVRATRIFTLRSEAELQMRNVAAALTHAVAALEISPGDAMAKGAALSAAKDLGDGKEVEELLQAVGCGEILDRCAPLSLRPVERWVDEVFRVAATRAAYRRRQEQLESLADQLEESDEVDEDQNEPPKFQVEALRENEEVTDAFHSGFTAWAGFRSEDMQEPLLFHEWTLWLGGQLSVMNWRFTARRKGLKLTSDSEMECFDQLSPRSQQRWAVEKLVAAYEAAGRPAQELPYHKTPCCDADLILNQVSHNVPSLKGVKSTASASDPTASTTTAATPATPATSDAAGDLAAAAAAAADPAAGAPASPAKNGMTEKLLEKPLDEELEITFGTGGLALPKFGAEKKPGGSEAPAS